MTPSRPKFVLAVLWLHHIFLLTQTRAERDNQQSHQVPPLSRSAAADWMSLSRRISTTSRDWSKLPTISCQFLITSVRLHLESLPPEFGWSHSINVPGSFRNPHSVTSAEQWLTWAITNLYKNTHRPWIRNSRGKEIIKRKGWVSSISLFLTVLCCSYFVNLLETIPSCFWNTVAQLKFHRRFFFSILTSVFFI